MSKHRLTRRAALAIGLSMPFVSTRAQTALPEIPPIPEKLKGTGELRIATFGGFMQDSQKKAYFEPFELHQDQGDGRHQHGRMGPGTGESGIGVEFDEKGRVFRADRV
jgi:hypothetical protein